MPLDYNIRLIQKSLTSIQNDLTWNSATLLFDAQNTQVKIKTLDEKVARASATLLSGDIFAISQIDIIGIANDFISITEDMKKMQENIVMLAGLKSLSDGLKLMESGVKSFEKVSTNEFDKYTKRINTLSTSIDNLSKKLERNDNFGAGLEVLTIINEYNALNNDIQAYQTWIGVPTS
jgi:hypothetical protein